MACSDREQLWTGTSKGVTEGRAVTENSCGLGHRKESLSGM